MKKVYVIKSFIILFLISFASISVYSLTIKSSDQKEVTLQLKWKHQFQFAGYYAADLKGFYKEKNIKVKFKEAGYGTKSITEVLNKKADFGIATPYILLDIAEKKPLCILSTIFQHSPNCIITKKGSGIKTPHQLSGKTLMADIEYDAAINAMLVREGVKNITIVKQSYDVNDFLSDKVDSLSAYTTNEPYLAKEKGFDVNIINPLNYGIDFYGDLLFTSKSLANSDTGLVKDFRDASIKGWQYALKNPEEIIDHIRKKYRPDLSFEKLYNEYTETKKLIMPHVVETGHINKGRLEHILDIFKSLDMISKDATLPDDYIFTNKNNDFFYKYLLHTTLFIFTILLIVFFWNYQLRKKVKKATREALISKENYKNLISNLPGIVFREKIGKLKNTIFLSDGIKEITGYDSKEFVGDTPHLFSDLILSEDKTKVSETLEKAISEKATYQIEYRIITKTKDIVWVFEKGRFIQNEEGCFIEGIILNTTEKNKLKEAIIQSAKMLSIGGIAAGIAHEINNPLSGIVQSSQNIRRRLDANNPKNKKVAEEIGIDMIKLESYLQARNVNEFIDGIQNAGMRASTIIKNLLSFSRKSKNKMIETDLKMLLNQTINIASNEFDLLKNIDFKKIQIVKDIPEGSFSAKVIPSEIEQVFLNILKNSFQVLFENNIEPKKILIRFFKDEKDNKIIEIANNGPEIDTKIRKSIFEPFFTTRHEGSGTGLGLSISFFIINDHHNGNIDVYSNEEYGAIFKISLP